MATFSYLYSTCNLYAVNIMTPQYTYDSNGNPIGVFIPINDWNVITEKYSGIEDVPDWEKKLIDKRLDFIKQHPDQLVPIEDFIAELDADDDL